MWKKKNSAVTRMPDGREICNRLVPAGRKEYHDRVLAMWKRQNGLCCLCHLPLRKEEATFEHTAGRGMGGAKRDDRIKDSSGRWINGAAHGLCNMKKGSRRSL